MPADRRNRIEVDLNVLKANELDRLNEFANKFEKSVGDLVAYMGSHKDFVTSMASRVGGSTVGAQTTPGLGPNMPTAPPSQPYHKQVREYTAKTLEKHQYDERVRDAKFGNERQRAEANRQQLREQFLKSNGFGRAMSKIPMLQWGERSLAPAALTSIEEENFTIDNLARSPTLTNTMQIIGHRMQRAATETGIDGLATVKQGKMYQHMNSIGQNLASGADAMIVAQRTVTPMMRRLVNHGVGSYNGAAQMGYDVGAGSTLGWRTMLPIFTEGGRRSLAMSWTDRLASLNPAWSREDQQQLGGVLRGLGIDYGRDFGPLGRGNKTPYGRDVGKWMQTILRENPGLDAQTLETMMDQRRRYRPGEVADIPHDLETLKGAAAALSMSFEDLTQQVVQTSSAMSQSNGMTYGDAERTLVSGAAMGMRPDQVAKLTDRSRVMRAAGMQGGSVYETFSNPMKLMKQTEYEVGTVMGMSTADMRRIAKERYTKGAAGNNRFNEMMTRAQWIYAKNPDFFGGMTPEEFVSFTDKDAQRGQLASDLQRSLDAYTANGGKSNMFSMSESDIIKSLKKQHIKTGDIQKAFDKDGYEKGASEAIKALGEKGRDDINAPIIATIELSDEAGDYFRINGKKKMNISDRNKNGYRARAMPGWTS